MWEGLHEEENAKEKLSESVERQDALPARTGLHRSPTGYKWKEIYQRGDEFYDWDGHAFHFFGGIPIKSDGSLAFYEGRERGDLLRSPLRLFKKGLKPREPCTQEPGTRQRQLNSG